MVKIYSDKTNKFYSSVEEANKAELELKEKEAQEKALAERKAAELKEKKEKEASERKAMAAEVEEARKTMVAAQKAYHQKLEAFVDKYKSYHFTSTSADEIPTLFDLFNFKWF